MIAIEDQVMLANEVLIIQKEATHLIQALEQQHKIWKGLLLWSSKLKLKRKNIENLRKNIKTLWQLKHRIK